MMASEIIHNKTEGLILGTKRESLDLWLRQVACYLDIDRTNGSKIERNERRPNEGNFIKLAEILKLGKEDSLVQLMTEKIAYEDDDVSKLLIVIEQKVKYSKSNLVKNKL